MQLITRLYNYGVKETERKGIKFVIEQTKLKNETTEHLTPGQVKKLVTAIHEDTNPIARMMELALFTGCRRGELLKLRWSDIDFDHSFIVLKDRKGATMAEYAVIAAVLILIAIVAFSGLGNTIVTKVNELVSGM